MTIPDLSVRQLTAILKVAKYSSFVAAAAEMHMSQPGLSRIIRSAENEIGVSLFDRTTRQVTLTAAGVEFLPVAERVLNDIEFGTNALSEINNQRRGRLAIACPMSFAVVVMSKIIADYKKSFPNISIQILEGIQSNTFEEIRSGRADFGFGYLVKQNDDFISEVLCKSEYHAVFHKAHPFARKKYVSFAELAAQPLISIPPTAYMRTMLDGAAAKKGFRLNYAITANTFSSILEFVRNRLGVSILANSWIVDDPNLKSCPIRSPSFITDLALMRLKSRPISPAAAHLMNLFRQYFQ